jgi:dolichyl-phosphate beta-glucosyltransferase
MQLSVVIPAYNEARRLPSTLEEIVGYLSAHAWWLPAEIVVVNDGSSDETSAVTEAAAAAEGIVIHCVSQRDNRGKGAAVRRGLAVSRGRNILLSDADLATPISEIDALAGAAPGGVAVGSRALDRARIETPQPLYRDLMGRIFNLAVRVLAIGGIADTQCGFKLLDGDLGRALATVQRIDGFAFDVELLVWARAWGCPVREVPVRWRHVEESRVQPLVHSADMFGDLLRIFWWRITGRFPAGGASTP